MCRLVCRFVAQLHSVMISVMVGTVCNQKLLTDLVSCRCAAMDFRGHGDTTTVNDEDLSAETMARCIHVFMCGAEQ